MAFALHSLRNKLPTLKTLRRLGVESFYYNQHESMSKAFISSQSFCQPQKIHTKQSVLNPRLFSSKNQQIEYGKLKAEHCRDVDHLIYQGFIMREPMSLALNVTYDDFKTWFPSYIQRILFQDASLGSWSSVDNRCVGCVLNELDFLGEEDGNLASDLEGIDNKIQTIFKCLRQMEKDINLFEKFQTDKIFRIQMLSVSEEFGGRGIGGKLLSESLGVAKTKGFKLVATDATGKFSQKAFEKLGFTTLNEIRYHNFVVDGKFPFDAQRMGIHQSCKLMYKVLV